MVTELSDLTPNTNVEDQSGKSGIKVLTSGSSFPISAITTEVGGTTPPTRVYVLDSSQAVLVSGAISGTTGTLNSGGITLSSNTIYFFAVDNAGSNYTLRKASAASSYYPHPTTNFIWTAGLNHNGTVLPIDDWTFAIVSVTGGSTNATVNPSTLSMSFSQGTPTIIVNKSLSTNAMTLGLGTPSTSVVIPKVQGTIGQKAIRKNVWSLTEGGVQYGIGPVPDVVYDMF